MAIENEKLLNVRIKNKYDSYENWASSDLVLKAGEIAIAYTNVDVKVDNGTVKQPALLMKVGDGQKTFANLPWLSAKAADVLSVCKNEDDLTEFVNNVIADAGIATDEALKTLAGRVTTAEGAITTLNSLVGTTAVQTQISNAITALNLANTYAAKSHTHVKADITDFAHTHVMADVTDLANELAKYQLAGDYATKAEAKGYADAKDEAIAAAKKAGDDAQADVDALKAKVGTVPEGKTVVGMIAEAQAAATYDDTEVRGLITTAQGEVDALEQTHATDKADLEAAIALKADQTDLDAVSAVANAAVKQSDYDTKVKALEDEDVRIAGLVSAEETRAKGIEQGLETRLAAVEGDYLKGADKTALQGSIDTVSGKVTTLIGEDANKSVRTIANEELAAQLIAGDAKESLDTLAEIAAWIQSHPDDASAMNEAIVALQKQLQGIAAGEGTVKKYVDDAISALAIGDYAKAADLTALAGRVTTAENKLEDIAEGAQVNVIETVKVNGVALTPDASKAVDVPVPTGALASKNKIAKADLEEALANELDAKATKDDLTLAEGRIKALEDANKEGGAVATAIKAAQDAADAAQADADALELLVGNETVSNQIDAKITALNLANTYEAKGTAATEAGKVQTALNTYKTDNDAAVAAVKATADSAVQTVTAAADGGLKATRTGNDVVIAIDEALTFVLDCGTSAE